MNIKIYSTTTCAFCKVEKQWLDKLGWEYQSVNIDEDENARTELQETYGSLAVPVTVISDGDKVVGIVKGFDRPMIQHWLSI